MRILVMGATGQLGTELCKVLGAIHDVIPFSSSQIDINQIAQVIELVEHVKPDIIINTAAYTDVDGCEMDSKRAFLVNSIGARNAAIAARKAGSKLVQISTDYVFDGGKCGPYVEYDSTNPLNIYGWSKLVGEQMVKAQNPCSFILRVAWLYGPVGKNFVKTMITLAQESKEIRVVDDQRGTPTFVGDVARQIKELIETDCFGLYHCTSRGSCTWYEFATEIFRLLDIPIRIVPVKSNEFPRPAKRPANSVLDNFMLGIQGLDVMPPWEKSLAAQIWRIEEAIKE